MNYKRALMSQPSSKEGTQFPSKKKEAQSPSKKVLYRRPFLEQKGRYYKGSKHNYRLYILQYKKI